MMLKWVIAAVIIYGGFVALLYLAQRSLQYFPERRRTVPSAPRWMQTSMNKLPMTAAGHLLLEEELRHRI